MGDRVGKKRLFLALGALILVSATTGAQSDTYDLILAGGRVMDPETGLDAVRHIGINGDRIEAISDTPLKGREVMDVSGLVVAPGFIDLHAHGMNPESALLQAADGVTTHLELEIGVYPVARWYESQEGKSIIHYGATAGHLPARVSVMHGIDVGHTATMPVSARTALAEGDYAYKEATDEQIAQLESKLAEGLREGGLGIGFGLAYTPKAGRNEIFHMFRVAARFETPCFIHVRGSGRGIFDGSIAAIQEVVSYSAATGAPLHIVHLNSSGGLDARTCMDIIEGAKARGLDISTEAYPYTAASTLLQSALFDDGWQKKHGITYNDLQWAATGERLTVESFDRYRAEGGWVIIHSMSDELIDWTVGHPAIIVASDGVPFIAGKAHPRGAGTFSRVLGRYVRERKILSLMDALRKMTLMPAQRLEAVCADMKRKGRVQVGADADLTIFDPQTVIDRATFEIPAQPSAGIAHVIVAGVSVLRNGILLPDVFPGRPLRGQYRE